MGPPHFCHFSLFQIGLKKKSFNFLSDFRIDATKLFGRTSGTHVYAQKFFLDSPGEVGGASPMKLLYFFNKSLTGGSPPPNLVNEFFFGHMHVFLMFFQTIWWHSFWNLTKIERFLFFPQTLRNPSFMPFYLPFSLFRIGLKLKKKKSFNFCPISEWMPPNCWEEHQEHTYMLKKLFEIHQVRWGEPPRWSYICLINLWREAPSS